MVTRALPTDLRALTRQTAARALAVGALGPIDTRVETLRDRGVDFQVRVVESLARKRAARRTAAPGDDPFLPYEAAMYVADVSPTHIALLNKFPVIEEHLLIVTRGFEDQRCPLTLNDFDALARCMERFEGLGFYNAGPEAGASQPHKHLQLVGPLTEGGIAPIEPSAATELAFPHRWEELDGRDDAGAWYDRYLDMMATLGLSVAEPATPPYNLLVTRSWMLLVPRARESFEGISVNALGFAGSLLVADNQGLARLRAVGPMRVLQSVCSTGG